MWKALGWGLGIAVVAAGAALAQQNASAPRLPLVKAMPAVPQQLDYLAKYEGEASAHIVAEQASTLLVYDASKLKGGGCQQTPNLQTNLRGNLAESWRVDTAGKFVEFKLRPGAKSPYGNELSADDVKWSLERAAKLSGAARFFLHTSSDFRKENMVEVVDPRTVRVHFNSPTIYDLGVFTHLQFQIVDSKTVLKNATADDPTGGSWLAKTTADYGPWQILPANFVPGVRATFTPNENYWNKAGRGNASTLVALSVPEPATRSQLLRSGEADFAALLPFQEYGNLMNDRNVRVTNCDGNIRDTILLNYQDEKLANPLVRQAISLAIDREAIVKGVFRGFGDPATTSIHKAFGTEGLNHYAKMDVAKAKALLAQAGYPNGFTVKFTVSPSRPGAHAEQEAIFVADSLKQIGVVFEIEMITSGTAFAERFQKGTYQAMLYTEQPAFGDPFYSLTILNHSASFQNSFKYKNEKYDALVNEGRALALGDTKRRREILVEISNLMAENPAQIYLVDTSIPLAMSPKLEGWEYQALIHANMAAYQLRKTR